MTYYESPNVTDWQKQIITGTVLGGSSLVKPAKGRNCYLFMRSKNQPWILYKSHELKIFSSQRPFTEEGNTLRWHSNCYPVFNEFREIFYNDDKKIVTMNALDTLRDIGLAIWYGDSGKIKKGRVWLNTHKFGDDGNKLIFQYFHEVGICSEILKERGNNRIVMTEEGSRKFLGIIAHRLPSFMHATIQ